MLKIVHIIPSLIKGGAERLVLDICNELRNHSDVQVKLIALDKLNEYEYLTKNIDYQVISARFIPSITGKNTLDIAELQSIIDNFKPDIIHTHLWEAEIVSRQIKTSQVKWFSHFHDNMPQLQKHYFPKSKTQITNTYERFLMLKQYQQCSNYFICISQHTLTYAQKNLPKRFHSATSFLPNAIDVKAFRKPIDWQKKQTNTISLVSIGSLVDKKNIAFLVPIANELLRKNINFIMHVLGDGPNKTNLQDLVDSNQLTNHIILHGNVDNVQSFLWDADIYIHPATYEPFGLVLLEAMAAGLPVICLDGGGNRDIIENGKNGFIIHEQDPKLFAQKIETLINNKATYLSMCNAANTFAIHFDIKEYVTRLLKIYRNT